MVLLFQFLLSLTALRDVRYCYFKEIRSLLNFILNWLSDMIACKVNGTQSDTIYCEKFRFIWTKHHWNRWKSIAISRLTSFLMEFLGRNKACLHNDLYLNKNWYIRFRLKIILHLFQPHTPFHYILVWETILAAYEHLKTIDLYFLSTLQNLGKVSF